MARRSREQSRASREIAPLPPMRNPQRRMECRRNFRAFCERYFPKRFKLAWSSYHLQVIARMETILIEGGGKMALAMPRGSGKTTLAETAVLWALLYGHCRYIVIIGANKKMALGIVDNIKSTLSTNKALLDDFPEAVYPFRKLNGSAGLARGQLYLGEPTGIEWKPDGVVFPRIPGSLASGARVVGIGLLGASRGHNKAMPDGETARPDVVVLDDPQTDDSARSPSQTEHRAGIIDKGIEGLVGPAQELAMMMTCTVIQDGDLADRYLSHTIKPQWKGMRFQMLEKMPENMELWEQYRELQKEDTVAATLFYRNNRKAMQAGAKVAWEANHTDSELDGLQHAMNIWCENFETFMSEYQNEPVRADAGTVIVPAKTIRTRLNGLERQTVPLDGSTLTGFIDVHDDILYYVIAAWSDDFTGYIIDYGTFPEQTRRVFQKGETGLKTLGKQGDQRKDGLIQAGLVTLIKNLLQENWWMEGDEDGSEHPALSKLLIDTGYKPEIVENAIRLAAPRSTVVMPAKGKGIKSSQVPMSLYKRKAGERIGKHWLESTPPRRLRTITMDTNFWKGQVHDGFALAPGNRGSLTLWGREPERHRMFSEQMNGETPKLVKTGENEVNEWFPVPARDNHFFDCIVGSAVAASVCGIKSAEEKAVQKPKIQRRVE